MNDTAPVWMIGDLQGCCQPLDALLSHPEIAADGPGARFWFAGDLVNRGPASLQTLRRVIGLGDRAIAVLGNHDLHLLAMAAGLRKPGRHDTFQDSLSAPDSDELLHWLRHRPLAHYGQGHLMVHAGVPAEWGVEKTLALAGEVQAALRGPDWKDHVRDMYGNEPSRWRDDLEGVKRLRVVINALTRMRMCDEQGRMEFSHKDAPEEGDGLLPWFDLPGRVLKDEATVVFGHWSTLGLMLRPDVVCLDTGCVWGRELSALRLHDRKLVQIACSQYQEPGGD